MAPRWLTEAELRARYGAARVDRKADRDGDGTADAGVVEGAIQDAEDLTESFVRVRFAPGELPTTPSAASRVLKQIVAGFAWWNLHALDDVKSDDVRDAYAHAERQAKAIASGPASLLLAGAPAVDRARPSILATARNVDRGVLTPEALEDW